MGEINIKTTVVLADLVIMGTGGILKLIFSLSVTPTRRGFFCGDSAIRYPFSESTIPNWVWIMYSLSIPVIVIAITELMLHRGKAVARFIIFPVPLWLVTTYQSLVKFLFGCIATQLITDTGKYTIGRLRPNFLDVCGPDIDFTNCSRYKNTYTTDYTCTKSNDDAKDSRLSFPSGHASLTAFTLIYTAIYIHVKWRFTKYAFKMLNIVTQLALLLLAYYTCLAQVMDNRHFWGDVLVGAVIGLLLAYGTARYVPMFIGSQQGGSPGLSVTVGQGGNELVDVHPDNVSSS